MNRYCKSIVFKYTYLKYNTSFLHNIIIQSVNIIFIVLTISHIYNLQRHFHINIIFEGLTLKAYQNLMVCIKTSKHKK